MQPLWKASTAVFLLQLVVGGVAYALTGNFVVVAFVAGLAAVFFVVTAAFAVALVAVAASFAAIAAVFVVADDPAFFAALAAVVVAFVAALAAVIVADDPAKVWNAEDSEPFWMLWVAALPLGIGTVGGGLLLLVRRA